MFKKILMLVCIFSFLSNCEYKPIYSNSNKANYRIIITDLSCDKKLNKYIVENLERNSQKISLEIIVFLICSFAFKYDMFSSNGLFLLDIATSLRIEYSLP